MLGCIDYKGAYSNCNTQVFLDELHKSALSGSLYHRLIALVYDDPRQLRVFLRTCDSVQSVTNGCGVAQGDCNGTPGWCAVFAACRRQALDAIRVRHPVVASIDEYLFDLTYADDTNAVGSWVPGAPASIWDWFECMREVGKAVGGVDLSEHKLVVYVPSSFNAANLPALRMMCEAKGVRLALDGVLVGGVPIGCAEFQRKHLENKAHSIRRDVELLADFAEHYPREAVAIARHVTVAKINACCRVVPPAVSAPLAVQNASALEDLGRAIFAQELNDQAQLGLLLPQEMGCLGLGVNVEAAFAATVLECLGGLKWCDLAQVGGFVDAMRTCYSGGAALLAGGKDKKLLQDLSGSLLEKHRDERLTIDDICAHPDRVRPPHGRAQLARRLTLACAIAKRRRLVATLNAADRAIWSDAREKDSWFALRSTSDCVGVHLTASMYRFELWERFGMPPPAIATSIDFKTDGSSTCPLCSDKRAMHMAKMGTAAEHISHCGHDLMTTFVHNSVLSAGCTSFSREGYAVGAPNHHSNTILETKKPDMLIMGGSAAHGTSLGMGTDMLSLDFKIVRLNAAGHARNTPLDNDGEPACSLMLAEGEQVKMRWYVAPGTLDKDTLDLDDDDDDDSSSSSSSSSSVDGNNKDDKSSKDRRLCKATAAAALGIAPGVLVRGSTRLGGDFNSNRNLQFGQSSAFSAYGESPALPPTPLLCRTECSRIVYELRRQGFAQHDIDHARRFFPTHPVRPFVLASSGTFGDYTKRLIAALIPNAERRRRFKIDIHAQLVRAKMIQKQHYIKSFVAGKRVRRQKNSGLHGRQDLGGRAIEPDSEDDDGDDDDGQDQADAAKANVASAAPSRRSSTHA